MYLLMQLQILNLKKITPVDVSTGVISLESI